MKRFPFALLNHLLKCSFALALVFGYSVSHAQKKGPVVFVPDKPEENGASKANETIVRTPKPKAADAFAPAATLPSTSDAINAAAAANNAQFLNNYYNYNNPPPTAAQMAQQLQLQQQAQQAALLAQQQAAAQQQQQNNQMISGIGQALQMCSGLTSGGTMTRAQKAAVDNLDIAYAQTEQNGEQYYPGMNQTTARTVGEAMANNATFAKGCNNFINKDGKLGPWGTWTLNAIHSKASSFRNKQPPDIVRLCPKYSSMGPDERDLFWVWVMASISSNESQCNPHGPDGKGPNGYAKGLFQLEYNKCPLMTNIYNPGQNILCAVNIIGKELSLRYNLSTPNRVTYFGTLRSDDWNKARGGDIQGAQRTRKLISEYASCK